VARTTDKPRLATLDPNALATEVVQLCVHHLGRYVVPLSPGGELRVHVAEPLATTLGGTVADLCRYAQAGELGDWESGAEAHDAVQSVREALYSQAGIPGTFGLGEYSSDADPATAHDLLIIAAIARSEMEAAQPLDPRDLAVLAGSTSANVRLRIRNRELRAKRHSRGDVEISAAECERYLAALVIGEDLARQLATARARTRYACGSGTRWLHVRGGTAVATIATVAGWERQRRAGEWIARRAG
jgi:hypothetical protein